METTQDILLRLKGAPLPTLTGFKFSPTDEELVWYYLRRKIFGEPFQFEVVAEVEVYKYEPWELSEHSAFETNDQDWYFFNQVDENYGNGSQYDRNTRRGYWKVIGEDEAVHHMSMRVGMKKTLIFHTGKAPNGRRTNWTMHEYRFSELEDGCPSYDMVIPDPFVLCRVFRKREEWNEDNVIVIDSEDVNGDEARGGCTNPNQDNQPLSNAVPVNPMEPCEGETLVLGQRKRSKHDNDPISSHANGSRDLASTSQDPTPSTCHAQEIPFMGVKENLVGKKSSFDSSTLEKYVPPGYLKLLKNLENKVLDLTMEKESLNLQVMRARETIQILQSHIDELNKENEGFKRRP